METCNRQRSFNYISQILSWYLLIIFAVSTTPNHQFLDAVVSYKAVAKAAARDRDIQTALYEAFRNFASTWAVENVAIGPLLRQYARFKQANPGLSAQKPITITPEFNVGLVNSDHVQPFHILFRGCMNRSISNSVESATPWREVSLEAMTRQLAHELHEASKLNGPFSITDAERDKSAEYKADKTRADCEWQAAHLLRLCGQPSAPGVYNFDDDLQDLDDHDELANTHQFSLLPKTQECIRTIRPAAPLFFRSIGFSLSHNPLTLCACFFRDRMLVWYSHSPWRGGPIESSVETDLFEVAKTSGGRGGFSRGGFRGITRGGFRGSDRGGFRGGFRGSDQGGFSRGGFGGSGRGGFSRGGFGGSDQGGFSRGGRGSCG